jgi:hypothetical protein
MRYVPIASFVLLAALGLAVFGLHSAKATTVSPATNWTIHIDALKHFPGHPDEVAHHWCRSIGNGMLECQIYPSDDPNAPLVAIETIVPAAVWKTFPPSEQVLWHYHRTEIPKVSATMPDVSAAEAKQVVESLMETYGKVYILWNPVDSKYPVGQPTVYNLQSE